jgi:nucleoside-diphosphate-sugar epimerase
MPVKTALVAGATGIVGAHLIKALGQAGGWKVIALARRPESHDLGVETIAVDLADRRACFDALSGLGETTHIFYAARAPRPDPDEEARLNSQMLVNLLDAVEPKASNLRHVQLIHGNKWYGSHLGPFKTPAREDDDRVAGANWYYDQQDHIVERQHGKSWTWSGLRPHFVSGFSIGHPHNIMGVTAVYGSLCRELGRPMIFPGPKRRFETLTQVTDAGLMSRAMIWAATDPRCANQAFNTGNGDQIRWCDMWPKVASLFGCEARSSGDIDIVEFLHDNRETWSAMVARHGLAPHALEEIADPDYAGFVFSAEWDEVTSLVKARNAGFCEAMDSEMMILDVLDSYRQHKAIPS